MMQLFHEIVEKTSSFKLGITKALRELLFNCFTKVLKSNEKLLSLNYMKIFADAFIGNE